jgi:HlyD family secretion protein
MNDISKADLADQVTAVLSGKRRFASPWAKWLTGAITIVAIAYGIWLSRTGQTAVVYETVRVTRGNITVIVTATGSVEPTNKVDVSSELSGTVRKVLVDYNSLVKKGQELAELDTDKLKATVDNSRAKLMAARARVANAKATHQETEQDYGRKRQLAAKKIVSQQDLEATLAAYERAITAVTSAEADVGVAEADLRLNETDLAKACICSPIDGVVLERNVEPGQTVASSFQAPILFSIAEDLKKMELQVDIDEADVGRIKAGQSATFSVDAYLDRKFPATLREIRFASEVVQGVVTYKGILDIDNTEMLLRPGMTATAEITVEEVKQALLVPSAALRYTPAETRKRNDTRSLLDRILPGRPPFRRPSEPEKGGSERTVWVLRNDTPTAVKVEIGATDGRMTEIRNGGIAEGDTVITGQTAASS